ncbi:MAG TPA: MASE1 domain-containing protein [Bryobacteraceae bacterium]
MSELLLALNEGHQSGTPKAHFYDDGLRAAAVCAAYYIAVTLALKLQLAFSGIAILWPSNAILVAVLLLTPQNRWWLYLLAVIPGHIAAYAPRSVGPEWLVVQIFHNSALAVVTAAFIRRFTPGAPRFERLKETTAFLSAAVLLPGIVAVATVAALKVVLSSEALVRHGWAGGWWTTARQMGLCNIVSLLGVAPGILVWGSGGRTSIRSMGAQRLRELILVLPLLISASVIVFTRHDTPLYLQPTMFLVPMVSLVWAALRFGARGAATSLLAIVCLSAWGVTQSAGPFLEQSSADRAVSVQLFWILIALPGLSLAAAIEERKRGEEELMRRQRRYELAAAAGNVAVWSYNYHTHEVLADPALTAMLGYPADDAKTGNDWSQRIHPDDLEVVLAREHAITSQEAPRNASGDTPMPPIQYRLRCADGSFRWVSNSGTLYRDGDTPVLAVGTVVDITDVKNAQEASLARKKLESLGVLAGGIAHDFNNLLGGILANAEIAETSEADGSFPSNEIQDIKTISIRASTIVGQLMMYAGNEGSGFEILDLSAVVAEMLGLIKISVSKSAILKIDLGGDLPSVLGSVPQIQQVVINLVVNASEALAGRDGLITVTTSLGTPGAISTVSSTTGLREGGYVQLEVSDTGSGISKEAG